MRIYVSFLSLLFSLLLISCGGKQGKPAGNVVSFESIRHASGFTVTAYNGYTIAEVVNPWDSAKVLQRYILLNKGQDIPKDIPQGTIIRLPLKNIVVYSAVHIAMIEELGELQRVIGVCEAEYMNSAYIKQGVAAGTITDLGQAVSPNIEKIIDINAELVIASPFQHTGYGGVEKLGIPIVEGADYMESSPLGRAEWIRFFGLLFDKVELADSLFRVTENRYNELKALTTEVSHKPTVLAEKRYGSTWFLPAGDSYMARLYSDAGANYIYKDTPGTGSLSMSFESVLDQAIIHADIWLIKYHDTKNITYRDLRREYAPYENFDAFKKRKIFGSNSAKVPYYEETPIHPEYLLEDLVKIFHPGLLPDKNLRYYHELGE